MAHGLRVKPDGTAPTRGREAFVLSVPCMAYCILTVPPYVSSPVFEWRGLDYSTRVLGVLYSVFHDWRVISTGWRGGDHLGGAEKRKKISFHLKGGSEGTLPGSRNAPFRAWGGSQGGGGVPSSHASSAVHLAPGDGTLTGRVHTRVRATHRARRTHNHTQP